MVGITSTTGVEPATNILIPASASNDQPVPPPYSACENAFCCIATIVFPWSILIIGAILSCTLPRGYDPEFLVHSAALQCPHKNINATRSPSEFTATCNLTLLAMNPNKKWDIYCDSLQATLFYYSPGYQYMTERDQTYGLVLLAATSLRPLLLTTTNNQTLSFKLSTLDAYVADDVANTTSNGLSSLMFGLEISVRYRYKVRSKNVKIPEPSFQSYSCNVPSPSWSILG